MTTQSNSLDALLPIRMIQVGGTDQRFVSILDVGAGLQTTTTTDPDTGANTLHVTAGGANPHSGGGGQNDADYTVTETAGFAYVGSGTQFTLDRSLILPASPTPGQLVRWGDECTTAGGSLLNHNLIINGNGKQIQSGGTGATGGILLSATYTATKAAWAPGSTIDLLFNGTFWKVV